MQILLTLSVCLLCGLLMSRITKIWNLPAVTAYLIAGILVGPYVLGHLGTVFANLGYEGIGLSSAADVDAYKLIPDLALGFIAFSMGNEFRVSSLKQTGKQAVVIAIVQAVMATLCVDAVLIGLHFLLPAYLPLSSAIILGAIATATAPASTLMVIKQYKAEGPVSRMLLPVVALDDVVGLIVFAISFGIASAIEKGALDFVSIFVNPLLEIVLSLLLGALVGLLFNFIERYFHSRSKRMSITVCFVMLTVALSKLEFTLGQVEIGFSPLLVCMAMGTVFCNLCDFSSELMDRMDRWAGPIMVLFFVLSGAGLQLSVFEEWQTVVIGLTFVIVRSFGKIFGAEIAAKATKCEPTIQKYLGWMLLPQEGVSLGMSLMALALGAPGVVCRNIALFAVLIYEMVGPLLTKISLDKAGEISEKPTPDRLKADLEKKKA